MIKIKIDNQHLIIFDPNKELINWKNQTFFSLLGFDINEDDGSLTNSQTDLFPSHLNEISDFLTEAKLEFETDNNVFEIISNIEKENQNFLDALKSTNISPQINHDEKFKRNLKDYQMKGLLHLIKVKHGANFSVPGSGKTTVVYAYYNFLKSQKIVEKIFVIGPFSSFFPWEFESKQCFGNNLSTVRLVGPERKYYYSDISNYELILCHYQTVANDLKEIILFCKRFKVLLVIDESHYIKRLSGGSWANSMLSLSPFATRRVILSGTPMPNGYKDLWSQMTFLWPNKKILGEKIAYKKRCENPKLLDEIAEDIRPFFYRVKKSDLGLPKQKFNRIMCHLNPLQSQIYQAMSMRILSELDIDFEEKKKIKNWRKAKIIRLLQTASNPTLLNKFSDEFAIPPLSSDGTSLVTLIEKYSSYETPSKIEKCIELSEKLLKENKKIIIWTTFIHNIKMLEVMLRNHNVYSIYGEVPKDPGEDIDYNREKIIENFKSIKSPAILIANPGACAESISLHMICHDAIYLDRSFNCGHYIQSLDRIHRIGLDLNDKITYHILISKDTIDETIDNRLEEKNNEMNRVLESEIPIGYLDYFDVDQKILDMEDEIDFNLTVSQLRKINNVI
ncbi:DEAD/DEAH box helicase [Leptospira sp. 201903075]|uniref:DEAD/DEAH box helicase n=1 Tax=Leptospira chreensis TaxID=2810035 RepID=UPI001964C886|nr:DEAD/DEAH box helicase [Leptospira chreensis]MBM9590155.1 DEAD/DEAH box helicase [Leptospira chreensis]